MRALHSREQDPALLEARNIRVHFAALKAVDDVDVTLRRGEILGLIGPNGAGKSTLVNAISGFQRVTSGSVALGDQDITAWPPFRRARVGLSRTFQSVRAFAAMTARENVIAGAVGVGMAPRAARRWADEILGHLGLLPQAESLAASLPCGEERRLGVARALSTRPHFVLLDEPAAGLNDVESRDLSSGLRELVTEFGCGLLIIEHDMDVIMGLCDRIQVLDYGKEIRTGSPREIRNDPAVLAAYLGPDQVGPSVSP